MEEDNEKKQDFSQFSDDEIRDILKEALTYRLKEKKKIPKRAELNNALVSTLGEFLSCYRLIGYDLDGNPIRMVVFKENMEKSALDNAFMEEIGRFMNSRSM